MAIHKHNAIKISCLFYLKIKALSEDRLVMARDLANTMGFNRRSLYTLLRRWVHWKLIIRDMDQVEPYRYYLGKQGKRYLDNLDNWYGPKELVFNNVLESAAFSFYWIQNLKYHVIRYPFKTGNDYYSTDQLGNHCILVRKSNCLQAVHAIRDDLGLKWGSGLIDRLVTLHFLAYDK